ncbi:hypothetical protein VE00_05095 [Pseudogymnoascus sp. WSF 3629]|nr:hypothetical protein VE00_05095 [Pseudogymnoascus sp. WSF 3629]
MFSKIWSPLTDMPDLDGKVAIVTGGNSGLGHSTVKFLALGGAKVYMAARSELRAEKAINDLYRDNPKLERGSVVFLKLDLASIKSVVAAVDEIKRKESRLDILVNNAGNFQKEVEKTDAGFEMIMAVCYIGHFVLVDRLLPLMKKTVSQPGADVRIVTVSSNANQMFLPGGYAHDFSSPLSLTDPGIPHPKHWPLSSHLVRYAIAKSATILFAAELQRRLDKEGANIISLSLDPGGVRTPGNAAIFFTYVTPIMRLFFVSPDKGAVTPLFAATAEEVRDKTSIYKGQYLVPYGKVGVAHPDMTNTKIALDLWNTTTSEVNRYLLSNGLPAVSA